MSIAKKKGINLALIFTLLLSLVVPSLASAEINHQDIGSLTIHKFEQEKGADTGKQTGPTADVPEGSEALAGVTYKIQQTHSFDGKEWTEVSGTEAIEKETNADGKAVFSDLPVGRYSVQEVNGPEHVILNKEVFYVDIPMTYNGGADISYDVHIYPKNEIVRGDATLKVQDEEKNRLSGAEYKLYKKNEETGNYEEVKQYDENGNEIPYVTDSNGEITVEGLEQGEYYFQETVPPAGYPLYTKKVEFEIKKSGDKNKEDDDVEVITDWKTVYPDNPIKDDLYAINKDLVTKFKKPAVDKDANGEKELPMDRDKEFNYNITIKAPLDVKEYKALGVTDTLDERLTYAGNWSVIGTDESNVSFKENGQTLIWEINPKNVEPGAEIVITFAAKIKPDAVLKGEETGIPNTVDLHFNNGKGSYTKPADPDNPDPYVPYDPEDPDKPTDTPDPEDPQTPEEPPVVVPTEGGMKVIKVDKSDNTIKLEGAEFKLTTDKAGENVVDATGTTIKVNGKAHTGELKDLVTGENGEFTIEGLTPGTYYLHETKAPTYEENGQTKSYRLLTKPEKVEIVNNKDENIDVTVENSKSGWELPTTGGIGTVLFTVVGLLLMGIALFAYFRRRETAEE